MTDQLPDPPIPKTVDLRNFDNMPLDLVALFNSDTWLKAARYPFAGFALINLWGRAWHQVPAGSLPNDEDMLQSMAQVDDPAWASIRDIVLRGFSPHSDGRLYHSTLCSIAAESSKKQKSTTRIAKKAANARWGHKKTLDAPSNAKAMRNPCTGNANAMQTQCLEHAKGREEKRRDSRAPLPPQNGQDSSPSETTPAGLLEVGNKILEILGIPQGSYLGSYDLVGRWMRQGADPETDIFPVIKEIIERPNFAWKGSLGYFDSAVLSAIAKRRAEAKETAKGPPKHLVQHERDNWRRVRLWATSGLWAQEHGPPPDDPACEIDPAILEDAKASAKGAKSA